MRNLRLLVAGGFLSYRALFAWLRPSLFIPTMLFTPVLQLLFFALLGRYAHAGDDQFYILGNAILACAIPCIYGPLLAMSDDRLGGTLPAVLASPGNRVVILLGRMLPFAGNGFVVCLFTLAAGSALLGSATVAARLPGMVLVVVVAALSCTGLGLALGALGLVIRDAPFLSNLIVALMLLVTGANVAVAALPAPLRVIGDVLPLTRAIAALRLLALGAGLGRAAPLIGAELAVGAAYALGSVLLVGWVERAARRSGALSLR